MIAKQMKSLELHYPMIQFLIRSLIYDCSVDREIKLLVRYLKGKVCMAYRLIIREVF